MRWPISLWLAPHCDTRQFLRLSGALLAVPRYVKGESLERLRRALGDRFQGEVFLFAMGRHALFTVIQSIGCADGGEVIVAGYTCASVYKTVKAAGATIIYADVNPQTLGLDVTSVRRLITPKTRAVICQHTFGLDGHAAELKAICKEKGIVLIEDCAHCCPDETGPRHLGSFGDVTLFSFGREKPFCGVSGGAVICRDSILAQKIEEKLNDALPPSRRYIFLIQLFPLLQVMARPLYAVGLGEKFLAFCERIKVSFKQIPESGWGPVQHDAVHAMPNIYAYMVLDQWDTLRDMNDHRRALVTEYARGASEWMVDPRWSERRFAIAALPRLRRKRGRDPQTSAVREHSSG